MNLERCLMGHFSSGHMCANIYVPGWWECDVVRVTDADWWDEVEIKSSVADFNADAKKCRKVYDRDHWQKTGQGLKPTEDTKHARLAAGDPLGPNRFWFAVKEEIADSICVPDWAGMFVWSRTSHPQFPFSIRRRKSAPILHREKRGERVRQHLFSSIYHRQPTLHYFVSDSACIDGGCI